MICTARAQQAAGPSAGEVSLVVRQGALGRPSPHPGAVDARRGARAVQTGEGLRVRDSQVVGYESESVGHSRAVLRGTRGRRRPPPPRLSGAVPTRPLVC